MLEVLEKKFGQLVAKKVFMFLRHPAADAVDAFIRQYNNMHEGVELLLGARGSQFPPISDELLLRLQLKQGLPETRRN